MQTLTVKEAVAKVNQGESLKGVVLEEKSARQVNVRDALVLNRGGIVVPEENLFYDDDDIAYDEDIDELVIGEEITGISWEQKAKRFAEREPEKSASLTIEVEVEDEDVAAWANAHAGPIKNLLRGMVNELYRSRGALEKE